MPRCKRCLLPSQVPGSDLDRDGICAFCRDQRPHDDDRHRSRRMSWHADLEAALRDCRGRGPYDAVVCLSGGKDSLYLLHRLKVDYGLNVLAFTTDANLPDIAWTSIKRTVEKLGLDHLIYRPARELYRRLFRYLLRNQEARGAVYTVSYVYAPLFEGDALAFATERGIPLVLAGYSPGQPEPERMEYEFSRKLICETDWTPPGLRASSRRRSLRGSGIHIAMPREPSSRAISRPFTRGSTTRTRSCSACTNSAWWPARRTQA